MVCPFSYPNYVGGYPGGVQGPTASLLLPPTSREYLRFDSYTLNTPPFHEDTTHLPTPMPSPRFGPMPQVTAISITDHNTGWVTF
ncbi:hypothetical protein TNCV_352461 [Trichonephila clavipes]|nr:hypothetical protein TNCV_352461 [Trichonephila clavipes]